MEQDPILRNRWLLLCLAPVLNGALAVALFVGGQVLFAAGALLLAGANFFHHRYLLQRIEVANKQKLSLDRQLLQSQKLASIGELSSGIAHEINNPLAIIGQEAEWMRHLLKEPKARDPQWQGDASDSLREILRQVDRCKDITHKLLDFARNKEPLVQGTDINRLLEDMVRLVEREAIHKGITIVRDYGADLPVVFTDPPLMRQVVLNLLNNAVYAVDHNGTITVTTRTDRDRWVVLEVKDTGCGIPEGNLSKIFDPFFSTKPQGKGTGLGLSICHGIVTKLGGHIAAESAVGEGTTFSVHLPLKHGKGDG